jgi:hypothetical protein
MMIPTASRRPPVLPECNGYVAGVLPPFNTLPGTKDMRIRSENRNQLRYRGGRCSSLQSSGWGFSSQEPTMFLRDPSLVCSFATTMPWSRPAVAESPKSLDEAELSQSRLFDDPRAGVST